LAANGRRDPGADLLTHSETLYEDNGSQPSAAEVALPTSGGILVSDVETERVAWLWRGWLALGKISVVDGDPGLGKSAVVLDIAARESTGRPFPDGSECEAGAGGVVILSAEDGLADTIKPRLEAAGADTSRISSLGTVWEGKGGRRHERTLSLPEDIPLIEREIRRVEATLVIVDPLMAFLPKKIDAHKDQDVRRALAPFASMAERTGVALQVVRHLSKSEGSSPIYRGGGSIGIIGAARMGALVAKDPKDEERRVLAPTKNNLAVHPKGLIYTLQEADNGAVRVLWAGDSEYTASELLQSVRVDRADARREAEDILVSLLSDGPVPKVTVEEEASAANISTGTLRRAKTSLGVITERENEVGGERGKGRWVWKLPAKEDTGRGVQLHDVQGAQRRSSEHLEQSTSDRSPESGLDMPNLQDAQATATRNEPTAGEHLEQRTAGELVKVLTVDLALEEINRTGSGPARQAEAYRRGEITKPEAVEQITKAILQGRRLDATDWLKHAPAVEAALTHPLDCECAQCW
jgi:AAA domain